MTKVKICGITNLEDAMLSAKFGADALGFNFYEKSPRYILPEVAREIIDELPQNVLKVGVFVNEDLDKIIEIAKTANLDAIQLHGEETPEYVKQLKTKTGLEIIKAFRVSEDFKPEDVLQYEVDAILLDAYSPKEHGGTGETFDWEIAKKVKEIFPRMYLAGGLNHENVLHPISGNSEFDPIFLDTCSGIESVKGRKDYAKLVNFVRKLKNFLKDRVQINKTQSEGYFGPKSEKINSPQNIYDFLEGIHARPSVHLGEKSLSKLWAVMLGFNTALKLTNSDSFKGNFEGKEYLKWMGETIGYGYPNSIDPMHQLLRIFDNDEEKAFDHYFAYLEEFKLEHGIK